MTGGQLAPTTLVGQKTATTPFARDPKKDGYPLKVLEMMAALEGVTYLERTTITSPKEVLKTKKAIKKSFQTQIDEKGFSMVEVVSPCPTYWGLNPVDSMKRIENDVIKEYPLGVIKNG